MITKKSQYKASQEAAAMLREILEAEPMPQLPTKLAMATQEKTKRQLKEIENEINEYETYTSGEVTHIPLTSLDDLLKAPIRCRLAMNQTVKGFADELNVSRRQILRYEEEEYENCSMATFKKIIAKVEELIKTVLQAKVNQ